MEWSAGVALKLARTYHGLSVRDVAEKLSEALPKGISHATLAKVEKGERKLKEAELQALVGILDFPRHWYETAPLEPKSAEDSTSGPMASGDRPERRRPKPKKPVVDEFGRFDDGLTPGLVPSRKHNHAPEAAVVLPLARRCLCPVVSS